MTIEYRFRDSSALLRIKDPEKADFAALGPAVEQLLECHDNEDGAATRMVRDARHRSHPAHRHMEWNNAKCGSILRLEQARAIISCLEKLVTGQPPERLAINVVTSDGTRDYYNVRDVRGNADLQRALLEQADRELGQFMKRYAFLVDVCELIDAARQKIATRRRETNVKETVSK